MIIQIVLIVVIVVIFFYFMQNRNTMRLKASKKVLFLLFVMLSIFAILDPGNLTRLANFLGVGRGADLLIYVLALAFAFFVLSVYLKFKDYDQRLVKLARSIALSDAKRDRK